MILKNRILGKTLVFSLCFSSLPSWARVHEFETARLKSTGGTGIGSVLLNESVVLNPAPLAVFTSATATYQRENIELKDRNPQHDNLPNSFPKQTHTNAIIIAEGSSKLKGAVGYIDQAEGMDKRQRVSSSVGAHITDTTAIGLNYKFTKETSMAENNGNRYDYNSVGFGLMHFYSNNLTIGLMMDDLAKSKGKNTKGGVGFQYIAQDLVTVMVDVTSNWEKNLSQYMSYRAGVQFKLFSELYARTGMFADEMNQEKGVGFGGGWVGPKLGLEFGMKVFKAKENPSYSLLTGESQKELAMSISIIF
ncbi:MAG: hypothetical protein ACOYL6_04110 [Bacteriovoracaceae bacterium]